MKNAHRRFTVWRDGLRCHGSIYEVGLRTPLKPQLEFSAREHSTNLGLKVFMDARMPVTHKEGDRYPLGPPSFVNLNERGNDMKRAKR